MALSCSKRLLRSIGSSYKLYCTNHQYRSFHILSSALRDHDVGDMQSSLGYSIFRKAGFPFMGSRGLSTSVLNSKSGEGSFPSDLLSRKQIITAERDIGVAVHYTKFSELLRLLFQASIFFLVVIFWHIVVL